MYRGLAGFYILSDDHEAGLGLPSGNYDVPLQISSVYYNNDGSLSYNTSGDAGVWGDVIQV